MEQFFFTLSQYFDIPILNWIQSHLRTSFGDAIMPYITSLADAGIVWILLCLVLLCFRKYRKAGLSMGAALLMGMIVCNLILKPLVGRIRPFDFMWLHEGMQIPLLITPPNDFSFPSGHTMASFCAATALMTHHKPFGITAMLLAVLIAFSRLYLYLHYPTDVLFSLIVGIGLGLLGSLLVQKGYEKCL